MDRERDRFDDDALIIARLRPPALANEKPSEDVDAALGRLLGLLTVRLRRLYPSLGDEAQDVAASAVGRYLSRAIAGGLQDHPNPPAYLLVTAENEMRRFFGHIHELEDSDVGVGSDNAQVEDLDRVAERLDAQADVTAAIAAAWHAGDHRAAGILQAFLDLASTTGATPSNRDVGVEAKVTHPTVGAVLDYAATWLPQRGAWRRVAHRRSHE